MLWGASRFQPVNTYLLMVTFRVDMTLLFPEHFLGDKVDDKAPSPNLVVR